MSMVRKQFEIEVLEHRKDGGRILINTASVDRDRDRVFPMGARVQNYKANPVVQWAHNYRDPWATVGRSITLSISPEGIVADFELRSAANEFDPQNIILLLWKEKWVRTASIGFIPTKGKPNELGGMDFEEWELLEWSIVAIPSNQDAVRQDSVSVEAVFAKAVAETITSHLPPRQQEETLKNLEVWRAKFAGIAKDNDEQPAADLQKESGNEQPSAAEGAPAPEAKDGQGDTPTADEAPQDPGRAWVRRLTVETGAGKQIILANFMTYEQEVPEGATMLQMDFHLGECREVPHPDAGTTVKFKTLLMVPPMEIYDFQDGVRDRVHQATARYCPDEDVLGEHRYWKVQEWGPVLDFVPEPETPADTQAAKSVKALVTGLGVDYLTDKGIAQATSLVKRLHAVSKGVADAETKRGRVLSSKNEGKIRQARDNLNEVLAEVEQQPEQEEAGKGDNPSKILPEESTQSGQTSTLEQLLGADSGRDLAGSFANLTNSLKEAFSHG